MTDPQSWAALQAGIVACCRCPRLVAGWERVAQRKVARFREQTYGGRAGPGFGDPQARLGVIGLAPAAQGGNRTGRVFTGDLSGDWLFRALHREDGLQLQDCYLLLGCAARRRTTVPPPPKLKPACAI